MFVDFSRLSGATLTRGSHLFREEGTCLAELMAYLTGEAHTMTPACIPSDLWGLVWGVNDWGWWWDDAQRTRALLPMIPKILGASKPTPEVVEARLDIAWRYLGEVIGGETQSEIAAALKARMESRTLFAYIVCAIDARNRREPWDATYHPWWRYAPKLHGDAPVTTLLERLCEV